MQNHETTIAMTAAGIGRSILLVMLISLGFVTGAVAEPRGTGEAKMTVDSELAMYVPGEAVAGQITIAGSDSMRPLLAKLAGEFRQWHPEVKIAIQGEGRDLLQQFLKGISYARRGDGNTSGHLGSQLVRLLAVSRELTKDEIGEFVERFGYKPIGIPIAQDAVAIYVHRDNPIQGLTLGQVDAIFSKTRNRGLSDPIEQWVQLGLQSDSRNAPIRLYGRDKRSTGTRPFFIEHALLNGQFRDDVQDEPGSASVVVSVSRDRLGIGYSSIGFQTPSVRIVPLAAKEDMPFVEPTQESVIRGNYPLSRRLYLYLNQSPEEPLPPVIQEFVKFTNSQRGQMVVLAAGQYSISASQANRNLFAVLGAKSGSPLTASKGAPPAN